MEVETISLGAGKDTVVFAATAAANGVDTITGFKAGNSSGDVLNFTATGVKKGAPVIAGSGELSSGSGIGVISVESIDDITFKTSASSTGDVKLSDVGKYIIITDKNDDGKAGNIYLITTNKDSATNKSTDMTIELLGTVMREGDSTAYDATNFA